jgi:hypothetical protein
MTTLFCKHCAWFLLVEMWWRSAYWSSSHTQVWSVPYIHRTALLWARICVEGVKNVSMLMEYFQHLLWCMVWRHHKTDQSWLISECSNGCSVHTLQYGCALAWPAVILFLVFLICNSFYYYGIIRTETALNSFWCNTSCIKYVFLAFLTMLSQCNLRCQGCHMK